MKHFLSATLLACSLLGLAVSCTDLSEVERRIDNLESRVDVLESQLPAINGNVESLKALAGGSVINNVERDGDNWTLTLSNGDVLNIFQGSIGVGSAPVMSIDSDGYWMADYGKGAQYVLRGSDKVSALGANGVTPQFGVDAGCWTVSYDSGKTFVKVKDEAGKDVKAISEGTTSDSYFSDVKYENDVFTLTLKSGSVYKAPVISSFLCTIKDVEDIQLFNAAETRSYEVEMKGVANTVLIVPQNWKATLSEQLLTITSPAAATKASIADSEGNVSIVAMSAAGYSTIAKVVVQLAGAVVEVNPAASVNATEVKDHSLKFSVVVQDVTSWKYIFRPVSAGTPDAAEILASGTAGSQTTLTFSDLDEKTSYGLFVLPVNDTKQGSVASKVVKTTAEPVVLYEDNLAAYNEGKTINIAGKKYSKAVNGEATVLTAESGDVTLTDLAEGVYILEAKGSNQFLISSQIKMNGQVALIGRYKNSRTKVKYEGILEIRGGLSMRDLDLDATTYISGKSSHMTWGTASTHFHIDACKFLCPTSNQFAYLASNYVTSIKIVNSDLQWNANQGASLIFLNMSSSANMFCYKEIVLENNIFYSPKAAYIFLVGCNNNCTLAAQTGGEKGGESITIASNTFYNLSSSSAYGSLVFTAHADAISIDTNLFWTSLTGGAHRCVKLLSDIPASAEFGDNIAFGMAYSSSWRYIYDSTDYLIKRVTDDPLETVNVSSFKFIPTEENAMYGAKRN